MSEPCVDKTGAEMVYRRAERTSFVRETVIRLSPAEGASVRIVVSIEDFSPFGIGLVCDEFLERGQQFTMRLSPATGPATELLYNVAYCQPTPDGKFRVGAEFLCLAGHCHELQTSDTPGDAENSMDRIRRAILA